MKAKINMPNIIEMNTFRLYFYKSVIIPSPVFTTTEHHGARNTSGTHVYIRPLETFTVPDDIQRQIYFWLL